MAPKPNKPAQPASAGGLPRPAEALRVTKTMAPDQPGARKLARQYGDALLCVRYRQDASGLQRYTTVEGVVDSQPVITRNERPVGLRVQYEETELRALVRSKGATWDPKAKLWRMPLRDPVRLGLRDRIVEDGTF